jgi:hypothetical protein
LRLGFSAHHELGGCNGSGRNAKEMAAIVVDFV